MKLYISGGISGVPNYEERFRHARIQLESAGYEVEDPTGYGFTPETPWHLAMKYDLARMLECDGVALLDGWELSQGARYEAALASDMYMKIMRVREWINQATVIITEKR